MNPETINQIKEILAPVALKIGQTAEWGWGVVVKQQYVYAVDGLIWAIIALIVGKLVLPPFYRKLTASNYSERWGEPGWIPFGLLVIVLAVIFSVGIETAITHFINPEYYVIEFFINLAR
jgi:hypothetical protein